MIDDKLSKLLNDIFGWTQSIRREAYCIQNDGIDDSAMIIQEEIEDYLHDQNINPGEIISYKKYNIQGKRRYDE